MKFTFKTNKPTGSYAWLHPAQHKIKINKIAVGRIEDKTWVIYFQVIKADIHEDGNPNCEWKWIKLKHKSESLQAAKDFLNENINAIVEKYNLYIEK